MATPMTADQLLAALKAEGLHVVEHAGWRTHNRAGHGGWGPMNGCLNHHTGGVGPSDGNIVWNGRSDLPGPLATNYLAKSGTVTMMANGRSNHAGAGSPAVLAAVINEEMPLPATHYHEGSSGAVDGNSHFYGLEISNLGNDKDPYPDVQYEAAVKWNAAICRFHKWSANSAIAHKEWSDWKPDPSFNMTTFRAHVADCLALPAGEWELKTATTPPTKPPTTTPPKEDDMPEAKDLWAYKGQLKGRIDPNDAYSYLRGTNADVKTLITRLGTLTTTVNTLVKALAENNPNLNEDSLVAKIKLAIADEAFDLDVTVHDSTEGKTA